MTMNQTPSANRVHIAFFGRRNAGKSSLLNAVTGQSIAVVSQVLGTTTDPVQKSMELLPLGPVVMIDTPGFDDEGELGSLRVQKAKQVLAKTDVAVLVAEAGKPLGPVERELLELFRQRELPFLIARSKADLSGRDQTQAQDGEIYVSAQSGQGIVELKERLAALGRRESEPRLVGDLLRPGQLAVLVTPIDASAPKGRIILPQQQVQRPVEGTQSEGPVETGQQKPRLFAAFEIRPQSGAEARRHGEKLREIVPKLNHRTAPRPPSPPHARAGGRTAPSRTRLTRRPADPPRDSPGSGR